MSIANFTIDYTANGIPVFLVGGARLQQAAENRHGLGIALNESLFGSEGLLLPGTKVGVGIKQNGRTKPQGSSVSSPTYADPDHP